MSDSKNWFTYEWKPFPLNYYTWEVKLNGYSLTGEAQTHRQMLRRAKKAIKRHNKMEKLLNG